MVIKLVWLSSNQLKSLLDKIFIPIGISLDEISISDIALLMTRLYPSGWKPCNMKVRFMTFTSYQISLETNNEVDIMELEIWKKLCTLAISDDINS